MRLGNVSANRGRTDVPNARFPGCLHRFCHGCHVRGLVGGANFKCAQPTSGRASARTKPASSGTPRRVEAPAGLARGDIASLTCLEAFRPKLSERLLFWPGKLSERLLFGPGQAKIRTCRAMASYLARDVTSTPLLPFRYYSLLPKLPLR
jgi:hypothetical protein